MPIEFAEDYVSSRMRGLLLSDLTSEPQNAIVISEFREAATIKLGSWVTVRVQGGSGFAALQYDTLSCEAGQSTDLCIVRRRPELRC